MRVPKVYHYSTDSNVATVNIEKPIVIPRLPVITNAKQREKCVKSIEKYVRTSLEYKDLIKYLKDNMDMTQCAFFQNFDSHNKKGRIEIHHEPYDLYTIVDIVMTKQEQEIGYIDELVVAEEVMRLHYEGCVGLIPLSITVHELVHDGKLIVPLNCVYGKFVEFTKRYYDYIDPVYISMLKDKVELTKKLTTEDLSILSVKYIYTNVDGFNLPKPLEVDSDEDGSTEKEEKTFSNDSYVDIAV